MIAVMESIDVCEMVWATHNGRATTAVWIVPPQNDVRGRGQLSVLCLIDPVFYWACVGVGCRTSMMNTRDASETRD